MGGVVGRGVVGGGRGGPDLRNNDLWSSLLCLSSELIHVRIHTHTRIIATSTAVREQEWEEC